MSQQPTGELTGPRRKHLTAPQAVAFVVVALVVLGGVGVAIWGVTGGMKSAAHDTTSEPTAPKSRAEEVFADLTADDWKVRESAVRRFAELDAGEQQLLQVPIEDALKKKLDDPKLYRLATVGPEREEDREKELEPFLKSDKYRARILESRELLACCTVYCLDELRKQSRHNLKQFELALQKYNDTLPQGGELPKYPDWTLHLLPYIEQGTPNPPPGAGTSPKINPYQSPSDPPPPTGK